MKWFWTTHGQALSVLFASRGYRVALSTSWMELCLSCFSACWALPGEGASQLGGKPSCSTEPAVSLPPSSSTKHGLDSQFNSGVLNKLLFSVKEIISSLWKCKHLQLLESMSSTNVFGLVAGEDSKDSDFTLSLECSNTRVIQTS